MIYSSDCRRLRRRLLPFDWGFRRRPEGHLIAKASTLSETLPGSDGSGLTPISLGACREAASCGSIQALGSTTLVPLNELGCVGVQGV